METLVDRLRTALAGCYTIERELGRGGMATVYLAQDLKHHRQVAIRVLHPEIATALGPERFLDCLNVHQPYKPPKRAHLRARWRDLETTVAEARRMG